MRKFLTILRKTVKWIFIVFFIFISSLFFRAQELPQSWTDGLLERLVPTNLVVHVDSLSVGFVHGLHVSNLKVYDRVLSAQTLEPMVSARHVSVYPFRRQIVADGLKYQRLPEGYYEPGDSERNARVEFELPNVSRLGLVLNRPEILGVCPERLSADVEIRDNCLLVERFALVWPDKDEPMSLDGYCKVDLDAQLVQGEVHGTAKQHHIRPLLVALDLPSLLPYMDAFTDIPGKVPANCAWKVNLVNADFDFDLHLDPNMGKYNLVPMRHATGEIHLHKYTRGNSLNYHTQVGPVDATGPNGEPLRGTVVIDGVNGTNRVSVVAESGLPVANLLKIGGFTGDYVSENVVGKSTCRLSFGFPRSMGEDLSMLEGEGHLEISEGQLLRMKGFSGLLELLAEHVPGFSLVTDSTQASCDYTIRDGKIRTDNIYIEGAVFSIKMYGSYDFVKDALDFTVRVQFTKKDSIAGRILHPLTWPFAKLLLEFRMTGASEKPSWRYLSVVDRVLEVTK